MKKSIVSAGMCAALLLANGAYGGQVKAPLTAPTENDVTLVLSAADMFEYLGKVNTQGVQGSAPFEDAYPGRWSAIGAFGSDGKAGGAHGLASGALAFKFAFGNSTTSGTWSVTNTLPETDIRVDLVFAMHAGGGSGAWLFDDHLFRAGTTQDGAWVQRMLNKGNNAGAFSNLTLFASGMTLNPKVPTPTTLPVDLPAPQDTPAQIPEPATLVTLLLGLGMLSYMRHGRKQS